MSSQQTCVYCTKECKLSDSKPYPSHKSKDRIHNRCQIKKSLTDKQQKRTAAESGDGTKQESARPIPSESKLTSSLASPSVDLMEKMREDNEKRKNEANAQKLNRMISQQDEKARKAREDASFFFDIKAGIAKPHEKRQFLHHRKICEIAPRFNDHGHQEEALGRTYDHSGKDLTALGEDSNDEEGDEDGLAQLPKPKMTAGKKILADDTFSGKRTYKGDDTQTSIKKSRGSNQVLKVDEKNPCWFCLSSPKVEKHLILSIGDHCYLTLAKGGLTDQHLLLLPIEHIKSVYGPGNSPELVEELDNFKRSLISFFESQSMVVVFFERNFRSVHWQLQVVPVDKSLASNLATKIKSISKQHFSNSDYIDIPDNCSLSDLVPPNAPYLYWQIEPTGQKFVCQIEVKNSFFPIQLPRMVLADAQIMDCPDRVDWRRCSKTMEEYIELMKDLQRRYRDYDIT